MFQGFLQVKTFALNCINSDKFRDWNPNLAECENLCSGKPAAPLFRRRPAKHLAPPKHQLRRPHKHLSRLVEGKWDQGSLWSWSGHIKKMKFSSWRLHRSKVKWHVSGSELSSPLCEHWTGPTTRKKLNRTRKKTKTEHVQEKEKNWTRPKAAFFEDSQLLSLAFRKLECK